MTWAWVHMQHKILLRCAFINCHAAWIRKRENRQCFLLLNPSLILLPVLCRTCMCVQKRSRSWWARSSPPCLLCQSNKVITSQGCGRACLYLICLYLKHNKRSLIWTVMDSILLFQWKTKRSLTWERWDWTGWGCRSVNLSQCVKYQE